MSDIWLLVDESLYNGLLATEDKSISMSSAGGGGGSSSIESVLEGVAFCSEILTGFDLFSTSLPDVGEILSEE